MSNEIIIENNVWLGRPASAGIWIDVGARPPIEPEYDGVFWTDVSTGERSQAQPKPPAPAPAPARPLAPEPGPRRFARRGTV